MFSGIVQGIGMLISFEEYNPLKNNIPGMRVTVSWGNLNGSDVIVGESLSVNGVCLTVVANNIDNFQADVSNETLNRTVGLNIIGKVNLEKAMKYSDRIGGHLVTGHVDGIAKIISIENIENSKKLDILIPVSFAKFITEKGSIALNGVSLTVNSVKDNVDGCLISVNLIPHTWEMTSFSELKTNSQINFEVDLIARNLYRQLQDKKVFVEALNKGTTDD